MRPRLVAQIIAVAALVAVGPASAADAAPAGAKPSSPAIAEQAAPAAAKGPSRFSVKAATCEDFLRLSADVRGLVIAWTAGRYHSTKVGDAWVVTEEAARKEETPSPDEPEIDEDKLYKE